MDIEGLGYSVIEALIEKGFLNGIEDIYSLKKEDIASLKKSGDKFAQNLIDAINKSKKNNLDKLISSLGIRHVGTKGARTLAREYTTMDKLMKASEANLSLIDDIGEVTAKSIYEFFGQEQSKELIKKLKEAGVRMSNQEDETGDDRFKRNDFCFNRGFRKIYKRRGV